MSDPTGRQRRDDQFTVAVEVEAEGVVGDQGGARSTGVFANITPGEPLTVGTFDKTRESMGMDGGVGLAASFTPGNVRDDFAGGSNTVETDLPSGVPAINLSGEGGVTDTGQPTIGIEIGAGLPGGTFNAGRTQTAITNEVTLDQETVDGAMSQAGAFIQSIPERIREGLGIPTSPRR